MLPSLVVLYEVVTSCCMQDVARWTDRESTVEIHQYLGERSSLRLVHCDWLMVSLEAFGTGYQPYGRAIVSYICVRVVSIISPEHFLSVSRISRRSYFTSQVSEHLVTSLSRS